MEGTTVGSKLTCACHLLSSFYCSSPYTLPAARFRYEEKAHQAVMAVLPVLVPLESALILKVYRKCGDCFCKEVYAHCISSQGKSTSTQQKAEEERTEELKWNKKWDFYGKKRWYVGDHAKREQKLGCSIE